MLGVMLPGSLLDADTFSFRGTQLDPSPRKFESMEVPGCVREPGWTCSVRSNQEPELLAGGICARTAAKGVAEPSSQAEMIKP